MPQSRNSRSLDSTGRRPVFITINCPLGIDFSSSGVISRRPIICRLRDGSLFPLLTLPVITVCSPSWRDTCSAVSPAELKPPAMVSCALSRIMEHPSFP